MQVMRDFMEEMLGSNVDSAIYTLIFIVSILGLISVYFSYMILTELKEMKQSMGRVEKLLESVE